MEPNTSLLECMDCASQEPLYGATQFTCKCGGLYDVVHDFCHIHNLGVGQYKDLFDLRSTAVPNDVHSSSGVWRFHELIMPSLKYSDIVSLGEGVQPFWRAGNNLRTWVGGGLDLWILPLGLTATGSFKDCGMTVMTSVAKKSDIGTIGCASTGDTSAAAAAYAAAAGMECVVILPEGQVTAVQLSQPIAHEAKVVTIPGDFDDCMRVVKDLVSSGRLFPANSINPSRIEGHQASVFLTAQFFGWELPDWIVVPLGNGSNTSSAGKGMRTLHDLGFVSNSSRILSVQSDAANPLATAWECSLRSGNLADPGLWETLYLPQEELGTTTATAARIGDPVSFKKVMREINVSRGAVLTAEEEVLNEAVMVMGSDGYFVCPQTGTALAGLRQAVERGFVQSGSRVVVVSTATGIKFPNVPVNYHGEDPFINLATSDTEAVALALDI